MEIQTRCFAEAGTWSRDSLIWANPVVGKLGYVATQEGETEKKTVGKVLA